LEVVMREELDAFIGAAWGECSPKRKGYRNGSYSRDLATSTGQLEEIKVPRDREGQFHTQAFERYGSVRAENTKVHRGKEDGLNALPLTGRKRVVMPSKRQADRGKHAAVLNGELVFPQWSEDEDTSVIRQRQNRNGLLSRSFQSHAWDNTVA
jgi:Transposase, Mutator family